VRPRPDGSTRRPGASDAGAGLREGDGLRDGEGDDVVVDVRDGVEARVVPARTTTSGGAVGRLRDGSARAAAGESSRTGDVDNDLVPAVRWLLVSAALLVFLAGVQLFVFPLRTDRWFAWTIDNPMTAVFLGASYWSAVALELTAARARRWSDARIAVPIVFVFTTATLVVTLVHIDKFHLDGDLDLGTRAVTWAWIAVYAIVPMLMVAAVVRQRSTSVRVVDHLALPVPVRIVLAVEAVGLFGLGTALLVAPEGVDGAWPWSLTPLTARAIGAWLLALGVAAGHACRVDDVRAVRPLAITAVVFGVLQAVALARHGDALDWGSTSAWAYVGALVVVVVPGLWTLAVDRRSIGTSPPSR